MALLYPRPKCKFGSNDRIVDATYVKCHTRPLTMDDLEGKSKDKVCHTTYIILGIVSHFVLWLLECVVSSM